MTGLFRDACSGYGTGRVPALQKRRDRDQKGVVAVARHLMSSLVVERATADVKHALAAHGGVFGDPGPGRELMRRLKDAFDPGRVLSPGRFVAGI